MYSAKPIELIYIKVLAFTPNIKALFIRYDIFKMAPPSALDLAILLHEDEEANESPLSIIS